MCLLSMRLSSALSLLLATVLISPAAHGQDAPTPKAPSAAEASPAAPAPAPAAADVAPATGDPAPAPEPKPPPKEEGKPKGFEGRRDQGIHYFREGRLKPAKAELIAAARMKGGAGDYTLHLFLGRVQHQLHHIEQAHLEAQRALDLGKTPEEKAAAKALLDGLRSFYGEVSFLSAGPDSGPRRGFLILDSTTQFIAMEKKRAWARVRDDFKKSPTTLPQSTYLPGGDYTANGIPFTVVDGDTVEVFMGLRSSPRAGSFPWVWVAGGTVAAAAGLVAVLVMTPAPVAKKTLRVEGTF